MFGKLFGRGKPKHDQLGLETSTTVLGIPAADADASAVPAVSSGSGAHPPSGRPSAPAVPGMQDLGAILATLKSAKEQAGGDPEAMAELLRRQFGAEPLVYEQSSAVEWSAMAQPADPIALLATLNELHEKGIVSDEQFEAQKRRLLG